MQELFHRFAKAQTMAELSGLLSQYFTEQGIKSLAVTYYQQHTKSGNNLVYDWATPALEPWHQYYLEQQYADIDRTLESSEQAMLPILWQVNEQLKLAKNKREKRMREESIQFGIDKGLNIPINGPKGDFVVLVLHQRRYENGLEDWQNKQYIWLSVAHIYLHFLRQFLLPKQISLASLTKREKECLTLTAQGMRMDLIAKQLHISKRTVNFHLQNANRKLGVNNKYLAVLAWKSGV
ncbi:helix-turn-helix transcriptional regulator [Legionella sp. D16C41]|uniref:helix-turn-helix transcriptional regulator n=1 Tax=Legionella sp. D16C41 TaxID=3402688 RepID=UPI003AF8E3E3